MFRKNYCLDPDKTPHKPLLYRCHFQFNQVTVFLYLFHKYRKVTEVTREKVAKRDRLCRTTFSATNYTSIILDWQASKDLSGYQFIKVMFPFRTNTLILACKPQTEFYLFAQLEDLAIPLILCCGKGKSHSLIFTQSFFFTLLVEVRKKSCASISCNSFIGWCGINLWQVAHV